jgi:hypothetical protein
VARSRLTRSKISLIARGMMPRVSDAPGAAEPIVYVLPLPVWP